MKRGASRARRFGRAGEANIVTDAGRPHACDISIGNRGKCRGRSTAARSLSRFRSESARNLDEDSYGRLHYEIFVSPARTQPAAVGAAVVGDDAVECAIGQNRLSCSLGRSRWSRQGSLRGSTETTPASATTKQTAALLARAFSVELAEVGAADPVIGTYDQGRYASATAAPRRAQVSTFTGTSRTWLLTVPPPHAK
jgi:hypothetical protein